jgi:hypothetical protein
MVAEDMSAISFRKLTNSSTNDIATNNPTTNKQITIEQERDKGRILDGGEDTTSLVIWLSSLSLYDYVVFLIFCELNGYRYGFQQR